MIAKNIRLDSADTLVSLGGTLKVLKKLHRKMRSTSVRYIQTVRNRLKNGEAPDHIMVCKSEVWELATQMLEKEMEALEWKMGQRVKLVSQIKK